MAKVEKLGNVYFNLDNVDEAARFYQDVLGLRLKFRDGNNWVAFDVGGTTLALAGHEGQAPSEGNGPVLSLHADDLDGLIAQLRQRGAQVTDAVDGAHERRANLSAPGGHTIVLYEPKKQG
jgi:catechol 2,3-dioxygenase-like lactoylglutathione lyase family enzyme